MPHHAIHAFSWVAFVCAALIAILFAGLQWAAWRNALPALPERIITHWGLDGTPDGWLPKRRAMYIILATTYALGVLNLLMALSGWVGVFILVPAHIIIYVCTRMILRINLSRRG